MTMSDRGLHPDLLDDEPAPESGSPGGKAPSRPVRRGGQPSDGGVPSNPPPSESQPQVSSTSVEPEVPAEPEGTTEVDETEPELPDWFSQVRDAKDPSEALRLLAKNLPRDQLEKDEIVSGLIGQMGDRRARELLRQQERDATEQRKREAAASNDLYTLGELTQRELQEQLASQQAAQAAGPFMDGVLSFQKDLPEAIQREVSGKSFGLGKSQAEGVREYLSFVTEQAVKLGVERELQRRESALRKSVLSEVNGDEPVPERDSGTPGRVREVTDEQIAAMSLAEYEALFDENGRPKPGVRHRSTRGVPVRQH